MYNMHMVTVFKHRKFKIIIYENDHLPEHVHILGPDFELKIMINSGECYYARGAKQTTINKLEKLVKDNKDLLIAAWEEIHEE